MALVYSSRQARLSSISLPDMDHYRPRDLHVVFASTGCTDVKILDDLLQNIVDLPHVTVRAILDPSFRGKDFMKASSCCVTMPNTVRRPNVSDGPSSADIEQEAFSLSEWADLLVLAPIDADNLAKMLQGHTDTLVLSLLRSWNVSKKIMLVPGMTPLMWEHPLTKKQLSKIRRKWNWVQVLPEMLWNFVGDEKRVNPESWDAAVDLVDAIRNQVDLINIGTDMTLPTALQSYPNTQTQSSTKSSAYLLPPELLCMIFDFTGDWELAQNLRIFTNLPPPTEWSSHTSPSGPGSYMETLELTVLRGSLADVKQFIATHGVPRWMSKLCIKLIMRFAMTPLLAYLENEHKDLFWATFGHTFLPDKASSVFSRTEILEFWRTSPSFLTKEYSVEALDGASRAGFVDVLEWWAQSGLPLKFTETALEQASGKGHIAVLQWWKKLQLDQRRPSAPHVLSADPDQSFRLKPGRSICYATQNGHTDVVQWWLDSGIPFAHEEGVAKLASTHGHVDILKAWHERKGSKMMFDNQVLVGATKNGHVNILEWWSKSGLKVEYKTCDIEEALEDGMEGERGVEVKRWWARNGLNLGVGTSEWMKTKVLNRSA